MRTGFVKWFSLEKGYGFAHDNGQDFFIHYSDCDETCCESGRVVLRENDLISFDEESAAKGLKAVRVSKVKV